MADQFNRKHGATDRPFKINDFVYFILNLNDRNKWTPERISKKIGQVLYQFRNASEHLVKRHTKQMRACTPVRPNEVSELEVKKRDFKTESIAEPIESQETILIQADLHIKLTECCEPPKKNLC